MAILWKALRRIAKEKIEYLGLFKYYVNRRDDNIENVFSNVLESLINGDISPIEGSIKIDELMHDESVLQLEIISNAPYSELDHIAETYLNEPEHILPEVDEITRSDLKRLKEYFDGGAYVGYVCNKYGFEDLAYTIEPQIAKLVEIIKNMPEKNTKEYLASKDFTILSAEIAHELKFDNYIDYLIGYAIISLREENLVVSELKNVAGYIKNEISIFKVELNLDDSLKKLRLLNKELGKAYSRLRGKDITYVRDSF